MIQSVYDISVIICAYTEERWDDLLAAIDSVKWQDSPPREIIVVVDHNPYLLERLQTHLATVISIENSGTRGLSGARNCGIAIAQGAIIAFLDDDAIAEADWLARLSRYFENPQVMGVGGTVEPLWLSKHPEWFPKEFYWVVGCSYQKQGDRPKVVRNPYGGCTCIRREVFEVVGGFKNGIGRVGTHPMGCEETELCIRAKQYWPHRIFLYEPLARIHHRIPLSRASWRYFQSRCYAEGLSKAVVARYVGTEEGLASERTYTLRVLPRGVFRGMIDGIIHRDLTGFQRGGAIIAGLLITTTGYVVGTISQHLFKNQESSTSVGNDFSAPNTTAKS